MKRIAAFALAAVLALTFAGCSVDEGKPIDGAAKPTASTQNNNGNNASGSATAAPVQNVDMSALKEVVMVVDGDEVTMSELRYQMASLMSAYEYYGDAAVDWEEPIEGKPARQFFVDEAVNTCKLFRAVERYAAANGFALADDRLAELDSDFAETVEGYGGDEAFDAQLAQVGMTRELYRYLIYVPELYYNIYDGIFGQGGERQISEVDVRAYYEENYMTTRHILKSSVDDDGDPLPNARAEAAAVAERIASGEDFSAVAAAESDDSVLMGEDITFSLGTMPEEYVAAAGELGEGEVSGVVAIDGAYVVILREPLDGEYLYENYDEVKEEYGLKLFREILDPVRDSLPVERTEAFDKVDVQEVYDAFFGE